MEAYTSCKEGAVRALRHPASGGVRGGICVSVAEGKTEGIGQGKGSGKAPEELIVTKKAKFRAT
ncbi:hypothetical protein GCM10011378_01800 [Hymenobacter glacieicola]|uniref:Uncharacterized protein n=1 Tax=Hymenobacter glacieicola TaxID=1562124 RepID=A0ABQ1WGK4_9BACT|nr:hypothetical protein GCM10011378_01800 [Hymenobacter glacieicola]